MRRAQPAETGNLDSLLDALTNVVGILVIMLVVAMIGVPEAMERIKQIQSQSQVTLEELEKAKAELDRLREMLKELNIKWDEFRPQVDADKTDLAALAREIEQLMAWLKEQKSDVKLDELRQSIARKQAEHADLEKKAAEAMAKIQELKARIEGTPRQAALPAIEVSVPNPRQPPPGAKPLILICQRGRIVDVDEDRWKQYFEQRIRNLPRIPEGKDNLGGYDCEKVMAYFERLPPIGQPFLDIKLQKQGRALVMAMNRVPDTGEDAQAILADSSRYQGTVRQARSANRYLSFWVWPDSYEVYVAARKIADELGMPAGWQAIRESDVWRIALDREFYCDAPRPPPPPPAPPRPVTPAPAPPGPPPRPPLRVEAID